MERRKFLQSIGVSAIIPISATQVVSANNLSELRQSKSHLIRYQPGQTRSSTTGIGDTFNQPPILEGGKAYIPDPDAITENESAETIIYTENGDLYSQSESKITIDANFAQKSPPCRILISANRVAVQVC